MAKKPTTPTPMATPMDPTQFWDEFMKAWYNWLHTGKQPSGTNDAVNLLLYYINPGAFPIDITFPHTSANYILEPNELPNPYLGNYGLSGNSAKDYKFVMLNLNPAGSPKFVDTINLYSNYDNDNSQMKSGTTDGALIQQFAPSGVPRNYSCFLKDYSCLAGKLAFNKGNFICGYNWWNNKSTGRMVWIDQFYTAWSGKNLSNQDVLALELCPFHRAQWNYVFWENAIKNPIFVDYIRNYILDPALSVAKSASAHTGRKPLVVGITQSIINTFSVAYGSSFNLLHTFSVNNAAGKPKYEYFIYEVNGVNVLVFKNTRSGRGNKPPVQTLWSSKGGIESTVIKNL